MSTVPFDQTAIATGPDGVFLLLRLSTASCRGNTVSTSAQARQTIPVSIDFRAGYWCGNRSS